MNPRFTCLIFFVFALLLSCKYTASKEHTEQIDPITGTVQVYNEKQVLSYLYDSSQFDSLENVIWNAPAFDYPEIPLSCDQHYHTGIDTTIFYLNANNDSTAIVILANYNLQIEQNKLTISGSHFDGLSLGVAIFSKQNQEWQLVATKKHLTYLGYYGQFRTGREDAGCIYLKELGDHWNCLCFRQGIGGSTGEFWGWERLYSIEKELPDCPERVQYPTEINLSEYNMLTELFSYNYHHNYYYPDAENQESTEIELITKKEQCGLYDLCLEVRSENYCVETNAINKSNKSTVTYRFSDREHRYLERSPSK